VRRLLVLLVLLSPAAAGEEDLPSAIRRGDVAAVRSLLAGGADVDARDAEGWTPLALAARKGDAALVEAVLERHPDLERQQGERGLTALHVAAEGGHVEAAKLLLAAGARARALAATMDSPLDLAANEATYETLKQAGAVEGRRFFTHFSGLLHDPSRHMRMACARKLAEAGPSVLPLLLRLEDLDAPGVAEGVLTTIWLLGEPAGPIVEEAFAKRGASALLLAALPCLRSVSAAPAADALGNPATRRAALDALIGVAWRTPERVARLDRTRVKAVAKGVAEALEDPDAGTRAAAVMAVAALVEPLGGTAKSLLKEVARHAQPQEQDETVRLYAHLVAESPHSLPGNPYGMAERLKRLPKPVRQGIGRALDWIEKEQDREDGGWKRAPGDVLHSPGLTGLAMLALLGDPGGGRLDTLHRAAEDLVLSQKDNGSIWYFGGCSIYYHVLATWALAELAARTGHPVYRDAVAGAVRYLAWHRDPHGGWGYDARQRGDSSVTAFALAALKAAWFAGVPVPGECFEGGRAFLDRMTEKQFGLTGYDTPGTIPSGTTFTSQRLQEALTYSTTAGSLAARLLCGESPSDKLLQLSGGLVAAEGTPDPAAKQTDLCLWLWGSMTCPTMGATAAGRWTKAVRAAALGHQDEDGAWRMQDLWLDYGGAIYVTAMTVLALEAPLRYPYRTR